MAFGKTKGHNGIADAIVNVLVSMYWRITFNKVTIAYQNGAFIPQRDKVSREQVKW